MITKRGAPVARLVPVKQERAKEILADTAGQGRDVLSEREFPRLFTAEAGWDPEGEG